MLIHGLADVLGLGRVFCYARFDLSHQLDSRLDYSLREEFPLESHLFVCRIHLGWLSIPVQAFHATMRVLDAPLFATRKSAVMRTTSSPLGVMTSGLAYEIGSPGLVQVIIPSLTK